MIRLCHVTDIPASGLLPVTVEEHPQLLVCQVEDKIYVVSNLCSHGESALADGRMLGCEIECELHKGRFDVTTGKATRRPAKKPISTYAATVEDGMVLLADDALEPQHSSTQPARSSPY